VHQREVTRTVKVASLLRRPGCSGDYLRSDQRKTMPALIMRLFW
jgi:hypothetical protein